MQLVRAVVPAELLVLVEDGGALAAEGDDDDDDIRLSGFSWRRSSEKRRTREAICEESSRDWN